VNETNMVHEDIFSPISFHQLCRILASKVGLVGKMAPVALPFERTRMGRMASAVEARKGGSDK